jgi:septation ring formation regulator EzrA
MVEKPTPVYVVCDKDVEIKKLNEELKSLEDKLHYAHEMIAKGNIEFSTTTDQLDEKTKTIDRMEDIIKNLYDNLTTTAGQLTTTTDQLADKTKDIDRKEATLDMWEGIIAEKDSIIGKQLDTIHDIQLECDKYREDKLKSDERLTNLQNHLRALLSDEPAPKKLAPKKLAPKKLAPKKSTTDDWITIFTKNIKQLLKKYALNELNGCKVKKIYFKMFQKKFDEAHKYEDPTLRMVMERFEFCEISNIDINPPHPTVMFVKYKQKSEDWPESEGWSSTA